MIYIHRDFSVVYGFEQNSNLRHTTWHITFTKPLLRIYQGMILKTTCSLLKYPPTLHRFEGSQKTQYKRQSLREGKSQRIWNQNLSAISVIISPMFYGVQMVVCTCLPLVLILHHFPLSLHFSVMEIKKFSSE